MKLSRIFIILLATVYQCHPYGQDRERNLRMSSRENEDVCSNLEVIGDDNSTNSESGENLIQDQQQVMDDILLSGKAKFNESCFPLQDMLSLIKKKLPLGHTKREKKSFIQNLTCDARQNLECFMDNDSTGGIEVKYTCGCLSQIDRYSLNKTTNVCYIPYGELIDYDCDTLPKKGHVPLQCQSGVQCHQPTRTTSPKCICFEGFKFDEKTQACRPLDPYSATQYIRLLVAIFFILLAFSIFFAIICRDDHAYERSTGFRRKPIPSIVSVPDIDSYREMPEMIFQRPDDEFDVDSDDNI